MVFCRGRGKKSEISSEELKNQILSVARKHFAQHGFQGASLKEVAREAGVAGSLLNYHFKDKSGLFAACTQLFAHGRMEAINRLLGEPHNRDEFRVRLELFVDEMLVSIINDPFGFEIIEREIRAENPMVLKLFEETMLQAFKNVILFFQKAQQNGIIRAEVDPMIVASLLFTATCDSARKDMISKKFFGRSFAEPEFRQQFALHVVNLFMQGVIK